MILLFIFFSKISKISEIGKIRVKLDSYLAYLAENLSCLKKDPARKTSFCPGPRLLPRRFHPASRSVDFQSRTLNCLPRRTPNAVRGKAVLKCLVPDKGSLPEANAWLVARPTTLSNFIIQNPEKSVNWLDFLGNI